MELKVKIHKNVYTARLVQGVPFNDEFNENLDSLSIIISKVNKMTLEPYDDVIVYNSEGTFRKHFLVANYNATMLNLTSGKFKYTIDLMSETKGLEKIVLPNICFKQPLVKESKKSLYEVIQMYVQAYTPKRKYDIGNHRWEYRNKYSVTNDTVFLAKTQNIVCPEFTFNAPTLRELLNYLFNVVDLLPVVRDNVIHFIDLSKPTGNYSFSSEENYITYTKSADNYSLSFVKDYVQGIGEQSHSNVVEFIGFRNIEEATLKMDNLRLETNFPIYTINKVYMYLWKKVNVYKPGIGTAPATYNQLPLLVQFDITDFIVSSEYRALLNPTYINSAIPNPDRTNETTKQQSILNATQYQIMTLAFNRGQKNIDGWGFGWSYYDPEYNLGALGWVRTSVSYLENLINFLGYLYPYGQGRSIDEVQSLLPDGWLMNENESNVTSLTDYASTHMIDPATLPNGAPTGSELIQKLKSVMFKIDYQPLSAARVKIHKKNVFNEEYEATDNQSTSMVVLETDGDNALYKADRVANELLQINGRYTDISHLLPLGAQNEDGYIIFKRSYSIYGNEIKASYAATKNYILKNYFTSVFSKVRNKTFMGINESVTKNENRTLNVVLSKTESYYDIENISYGNYQILLSQFIKNQEQPNPYYINSGIIDYNSNRFVQEINSFIVGNSIMCFDMQTQGNITVGNYINEFWPASDLIKNNKVEAVGCLQSSYVIGDSETGFTDYISFSIGNVGERLSCLRYNNELEDRDYASQLVDIHYIFQNYLTLKPLYNWGWQSISYMISTDPIWKNNGEIINFNYQIDYSNLGSGLHIGKEFLPLNDLIRTKEKIFTTYYDSISSFMLYIYYSVQDFTASVTEYNNTSRPILIVNIPQETLKIFLGSGGNAWDFANNPIPINKTYKFEGTNDTEKVPPPLVDNFSLIIKLINITNITATEMTITYEARKTINGVELTSSGTYTFKRFRTGTSSDNIVFEAINDVPNFASYGWGAFYESNYGEWYVTNMSNGNPKFLYYGQSTGFAYDDGQIKPNTYISDRTLVPATTDFNKPHNKNCFVFYNDSVIDFSYDKLGKRDFSLTELNDLGFYISDLDINELFRMYVDSRGRKILKCYSENADVQTISYFYLNENNTYTLVFSCEVDEGLEDRSETVSNYITVSRMFLGYLTARNFIPDEEQIVQSYSIVRPDILSDAANVAASKIYFEQGHTYKFIVKSSPTFFGDDVEYQDRVIKDQRIRLESVARYQNGNPINIYEQNINTNYTSAGGTIDIKYFTERKNWDSIYVDQDIQDWAGLVSFVVEGISPSQMVSIGADFFDGSSSSTSQDYDNPSITKSSDALGTLIQVGAELPYHPHGDDIQVRAWYRLNNPISAVRSETDWTCPVSGYYYLDLMFTPYNIPTTGISIPAIELMFFDNTLDLDENQMDMLEDGNDVQVNVPRSLYYQTIYISTLTNLNNRVYDNDNLLIGMNTNWANTENVGLVNNSFEELIDNNESEE